MSLQGESTLTDAEKRTEAIKHLTYLNDFTESMAPNERLFVTRLLESTEENEQNFFISNKMLFWLRDLVVKY